MTKSYRWILKVICGTAALLLLIAAPHSSFAQDAPKDTADVKKLNERLEVLEQTIKELKDQLSAIDEAKKAKKPDVIDANYKPDAPAAATQPVSAPRPGATTAKSSDDKETTFSVYGFAM